MEAKNIYNLIILDESGSMLSIQSQALSAMNETIQSVRQAQEDNPGQNFFVSLVVFNGKGMKHVKTVRDRIPAKSIEDIKPNEYNPNSCTPLYDAMGSSITALAGAVTKEDAVLVTIITDGMENASVEYGKSDIMALVEEKRAAGWTFAYIGANQDARIVAEELNIKNALQFQASAEGMGIMAQNLCCSTAHYFASVCSTSEAFCDMDDFFGDKANDSLKTTDISELLK